MNKKEFKEVLSNLIDEKEITYDKNISKFSKIHKYWSRKPWYIISSYVSKYSSKDDTVLDPFCGSGVVGLESNLIDRNFIGYDLNPTAIFLTEITSDFKFDTKEFQDEIETFEIEMKNNIMKLYKVSQNTYTLYNVLGKGNKKDYNSVQGDYHFKNKTKVLVEHKIENYKLPKDLKFPDKEFPKKFYKDRFSYKGVSKVSDMFSKRNLHALALINAYIENKGFKYNKLFKLAFSNTLLHVSILKGENVRPLGVNNYWIPDDFIEENVYWRFIDRVNNIRLSKAIIQKRYYELKPRTASNKLYNKSSLNLKEIENNSIDYVLTDPPYGDAIQYSELSFIWNTWLEKEYKNEKEVIINPAQSKGIKEFHESIFTFLENVNRVLKPGKYFTLCFQNKEVKIWIEIIEKIKQLGFCLHDIKIYDVFGSPYNKHWAKFSPKSDLYVTFKKVNSHKKVSDAIIDPDQIIKEIITHLTRDSNEKLDLNIAFDLFVSIVIKEVFDNKSSANLLNLDLKKIIHKFEIIYGNRKG
jgi:DNA modification methylase